MSYVIKNIDTGKYVSAPGRKKSYTTKLEYARIFPTREAADGDKCGNETVIDVDDLIRRY